MCGIVGCVTSIIYLSPGEEMPDFPEDVPWVTVEASHDGRFFGTGAAWRPNGKEVFYISLVENDLALADAVAAAERWAVRWNVSTVWVQAAPDDHDPV